MSSRASSVRAPRFPKFCPRTSNSSSNQPTPIPKMNRPPESWSTSATCFATSKGLCIGSTTTLVPSVMRLVCAARNESTVKGSQ